jgi:hypothetical protein
MSPQPRKSPHQEVLGSLPRTRPQRRSGRRAPAIARAAEAVEAVVSQADPAKAKKPKVKKVKPAPGKGKAPAAKAKAKAAEPGKDKPKGKAKAVGPGAPHAAHGFPPEARPEPIAAADPTPTAGYAIPDAPSQPPPSGAALVTTAVQAAGELAQIGLNLGGSAVKSALRKLPRP